MSPNSTIAILLSVVLLYSRSAAADGTACHLDASEQILKDEVDMMQVKSSVHTHSELEKSAQNKSEPIAAPAAADNVAAEASGVKGNKEGDLAAFIIGVGTYTTIVFLALFIFSCIRTKFPLIFQNNCLIGIAPFTPDEGWFGWYRASREVTIESAAASVGLDTALMLKYMELCTKIMFVIGVPLNIVMGPLHWLAGGNRAGEDRLSYWGVANVVDGSPLFWAHAVVVWLVCWAVEYLIHQAMDEFMELRFKWLSELPAPRNSTLMVEGIPPEYRSDASLKSYFSSLLGRDKIKSAFVVKDTRELCQLITNQKAAKMAKEGAEKAWKDAGKTDDARPTHWSYGRTVDSIRTYTQQIQDIEAEILTERQRVMAESKDVNGPVNCENGFIVFDKRQDAEMAKNIRFAPNSDVFMLSNPPPPEDIIYTALEVDSRKEMVFNVIGYILCAGLYAGFMPFVIGFSALANMEKLMPEYCDVNPGTCAAVEGVLPALGLFVFVSFLPSIIIVIYKLCFSLQASAWVQQKLQSWYFWFNVVFVILVTAVGGSLLETTKELLENPFSVFSLLAQTLPTATHFYLNYIPLQWATHAAILTRYTPLNKFLFASRIYEEDRAKELAEPEDQDYYGLGGRTARFSIEMTIGLVFCSLSPTICVWVWIDFFLCRVCYGYLLVFAETKKPDLGGYFFVTQLQQMQLGLVLYAVLMIGVLFGRAADSGPGLIAAPVLLFLVLGIRRFNRAYEWKDLPFERVCKLDGTAKATEGQAYEQIELREH